MEFFQIIISLKSRNNYSISVCISSFSAENRKSCFLKPYFNLYNIYQILYVLNSCLRFFQKKNFWTKLLKNHGILSHWKYFRHTGEKVCHIFMSYVKVGFQHHSCDSEHNYKAYLMHLNRALFKLDRLWITTSYCEFTTAKAWSQVWVAFLLVCDYSVLSKLINSIIIY